MNMKDSEWLDNKVENGLSMCSIDECSACPYEDEENCRKKLMIDAVNVLEAYRKPTQEEETARRIAPIIKVIRCDNCKYYYARSMCRQYHRTTSENWYCADAVWREKEHV